MLDDLKVISEVDKSGMLDTIAHLPEQIKEAATVITGFEVPVVMKIDNVIITGMGGSAISGDIVQSLFRDKIDIPLLVNRGYDLPKWAKKNTLAVFLSYSGDTEEILTAFKMASQKKCKTVCISSGGKLQELAEKRGVPHVKIPPGLQPRAAIAYLLFPLSSILKRTGLLKNTIESDIEETIAVAQEIVDTNNKSVKKENNLSKQIGARILNTTPQIYGWGIYTPIATRWRQQFNENSKIIAREDTVPESNHNDIVGWSSNLAVSKKFSCILFRDKDTESVYMSARLDFMKNLFVDIAADLIEVHPRGKSKLAKLMSLVCLGDFVSCYLAILRKIDPTPVDVITALKERLATI